ncbi:hypothetical protein Tco_0508660 [Tanacetum coccineum]
MESLLLVPYFTYFHLEGRQNMQSIPYGSNTTRRISLRSMDSFQGLTPKSPSSWHRSLAPSPNILRPHRSNPEKNRGLRRWNDPVVSEEASRDYENPDLEQLLRVMECKVGTLMKDAISLMGRIEDVFRMTNNEMYQLPPEPSRQEEFEHIVTNFILDQEEKDEKDREDNKVSREQGYEAL